MITLLKFVHLAAIAIWSGGLLVLPLMFRQRQGLAPGPELDRLHRFTRFIYVGMTSPAAFVAIGSGTALIFLQTTFVEWFSLKMVLVGGMAMLHVVAGLVMAQLYEPGGRFGRVAMATLTTAYTVLIVGVIWLVLAKPNIDSNAFAEQLFAPGGLHRLIGPLLPPGLTPWLAQWPGDTRMPMP